MNIVNYARRTAQGALVACLLVLGATEMGAQCTLDPLPAYAPIPVIPIYLDAGGQATVNGSVVASYFQSDCDINNLSVRIYQNPTGGSSVLSEDFGCAAWNTTITRYLTVRNLLLPGSESVRREFRVTVIDNLFPTMAAIGNVNTTTAPSTACSRVVTGIDAVTTDNCGVTKLTYTMTGATNITSPSTGINQASGTTFLLGTTTVTYTASDAAGNSVSRTFTVTVTDNDAPSLTCPTPAGAYAMDMNRCYVTGLNLPPVTSDNCGGAPTVTFNTTGALTTSGTNNIGMVQFPAGATNVTYTSVDGVGNSVSCGPFVVNVVDNQYPVFAMIPPNVTIGTNTASGTPDLCDATYTWQHPTVTDNCAGVTLEISIDGGAYSPIPVGTTTLFSGLGLHTIQYRATDMASIPNSTTTPLINITVTDNSAPVISPAPVGQTFSTTISATDCSKVITFDRPGIGATMDCGGTVTMQEVVVSGPDLNVMSFPAVPAFNPMTGGGTVTVQFPAGITRVAYYWWDNAMNFDSVHYTFIVKDQVAPVAKCNNLTRNLSATAPGAYTLTAAEADNGSADFCPLGTTVAIAYNNMSPYGATLSYTCANVGVNAYTLKVTDASGNSHTATCNITIVDNTAPVITCPSNSVHSTGASCSYTGLASGGSLMTSDNCSVGAITWAVSGATTASGTGTNLSTVTFNKGNNTVLFTVKDNATPPNQSTCSFSVSVVDDVDPLLTVNTTPAVSGLCSGGVITRNVNTVSCTYFANGAAPIWTVSNSDPGNCSLPVSVTTTGGLPTGTYQMGDTPISITAIDASGNVTNCNFIVRVQETTKPNAICKDTTINLSVTPVVVPASSFNNNSTDNCTLGDALTLELIDAMGNVIPGINVTSTSCSGSLPAILKVTDFNNNWDTCHAKVVLNDIIPPTCGVTAATIALNASGTATIMAGAINSGSSDNCGLHLTTPFVIATSAAGLMNNTTSLTFNCNNAGANTIYFKATDKSGNFCTATTTVTVVDNIPPVGTGPADELVSCDLAASYLSLPATISVVENCTYTVTKLADMITNLGCPNNYQVLRTWEVRDASGNTDLVYQTVTVEDDQKPLITLPANTTLNLSAYSGNCHPTVAYTATVTDNCGGMVTTTWEIKQGSTVLGSGTGLTATPLMGYNIGLNTITFRATDACGNTITNSMTVTVVDDAAPLFSTYYVPATTSTSYCNHPTFVYSNTFNTCAYTFNWVRPWTGDLTDCSTVTFGPESIVANTPTGIQTLTANFPWSTTNPLTEFVPVSISLPVGTTTFTYTATDAAGRTATCSFNVQVNDTQAPALSGVQTATLASICPTQKVPDYRGLAQINDNCPSNVTLTQSIVSPNNIPWIANTTTLTQVFNSPAAVVDNATFVVRITATDGVNPVATRDITVTLDDNVAPVPDVTNLSPDTSYCGYIILPTPTAKTNDCGNNTGVTVFGTPGGVSALAETTDMAGNITNYRVTLPPNPGQPTCQTYFITWSYNDGNGNVATQPQTVTVCPDLTPPVAKCKTAPVDVVLNATTATITPAAIDGGSYDEDDCNTFVLSLNKTSFTCADVSTTAHPYVNVVLTATSTANSAHTDTCHARVRVVDNLAPSINMASVPANITVDTCAIGYMPPAPATVTAVDSCGATVTMAQTSTQTTSGNGKYNYAITRTWTAADAFGNTSSAQQVITVRDNKKPVFTTPATIMVNTLPVTNNCSASVQFKLSDMVSDCAPDSELVVVVTPPYFNMTTDITETLPVGTHTIAISATDPSGNVANTTVAITVKDATKPIASCINGISVALNANGQAIVTPQLVNNQSYDNCTTAPNLTLLVQELYAANGDTIGNPASELVFDCFEADNDTEYPLILWVKDQAGNFNFCETYVVIQDNVAPTLTCPANVTIECSNNPAAFSLGALGNATVTDNCLAALPTPTYTDAPASLPGYLCGSRTRTFKVTDISGNTATCTQSITVVDNKPPVFVSLPQNDTILCNDPLVGAPVMAATDNCTPADSIHIVLSQVKSDSVGVCGKYQYKVTRKWTATDKCGNATMHTQILTVRDTLGPVFLGMPDTLKILTANYAPAANCTAPVAFNAAQYFSECALLSECTINAITFQPALAIMPAALNVSGNYPMGNTKIFFRVTDPCGNVGRDSIVINVRDNSSPTMVCNNSVEVVLSSNGQAELETGDIDLGSGDNCGIDTMYLSKTLFDCEDLGVNQVTLTAVDVNNNANSCTIAVTVTAGPNTGFTLNASAVAPAYFGAANGSATAVVTSGSGTFTYKWSNNAVTATATGLVAGTYTVTVTDSFTGCKQTATVTVQDGPKVLFTVGNTTGAQNTIVKVPVTVTNFQQLSGFTFSLNVANNAVGTIGTPSVANVNAALGTGLQTSVSGNTLSVLYLNSQGQNIDLPDGTVLFNLCVQLSGASLGSMSAVNIENTPVQFTVIRQTGNGPLTIATDAAVNGSVQITQGLNDYDLGGDIYPWQNPMVGVPGVAVSVTGPTTPLNMTTPATGAYLFNNIVANTNTTTAPAKSQAGNTKIDIIDQGLMLKHIFATAAAPSPLTSAYQRVAADVNFDGQINIVDFALVQRLLLGTVQHLEGTNARDWVFIPKSYTFPANVTTPFPSPVYPALPVFPRTIAHNPLIQDELGDDFVAVRMGDLNGDAPLSFQQTNVEERSGTNLQLRVQNQEVVAGQTIELAVKAADFADQKGYQFTFAFDPNVFELQNIVPGAVPGLDANANFGTVLLSEGLLSTAWVNTEAVSLEADATLFTLHLKALESVAALDGLLRITNELVQPISIDAADAVNGVTLELTDASVTSTHEGVSEAMTVYQNQPNPFRAETTIGFRLPKSDRATVRIYTVNGRLVKTVIGDFEKGYNAIQVRKGDLSGAGVYWYEVTSGAFSDRKKMIILD